MTILGEAHTYVALVHFLVNHYIILYIFIFGVCLQVPVVWLCPHSIGLLFVDVQSFVLFFAVIALFLTHSTTPKRQNDIYILYHMIFVCWSITVSSIAHVCMHASIIRRSFSVLFLTSICVYVSVCVYALRALHVHRMRNHFSFKSSPSSSPPSKRTERM